MRDREILELANVRSDEMVIQKEMAIIMDVCLRCLYWIQKLISILPFIM